MRLLTVAERELRAAARRKVTYYVRWITALAFFGFLLWLLWVFDGLQRSGAISEVFTIYSVFIWIYCLIVGTTQTADCLSSEKREGTIGLLYLANLNSLEIVFGKLCSSAIAAAYGLMAIFPVLALLLLMGGVTAQYFWLTILALVNAIFFSLAVGLRASAFCVRQFTAVATAAGMVFGIGGGFLLVAALVQDSRGPGWVVSAFAVLSPLCPLLSADGGRLFGLNLYWPALGVNLVFATALMLFSALQMSRTWRDKSRNVAVGNRFKFWRRRRPERHRANAALRQRLLNINPFFWLAERRRVSSPVFMVLSVILILITVFAGAPYFGGVVFRGTTAAYEGWVFAWLWCGLALFALTLYYAAMVASQRLAEDKQTGALEMVLSTPANERTISRGLWLAYGRRMFFPLLLCGLVHFFFLWQFLEMFALMGELRVPQGATAGELFWAVLTNQTIRGVQIEWQLRFMFLCLVSALGLFFLTILTVGWVARWLGLRMKHPGFAPFLTLGLIMVPPVLEFSFACYLADKFNWDRFSEERFLPLMMWIAVGIGVCHCAMLRQWAAGRLKFALRVTVTSRFQPPNTRPWWQIGLVGLVRLVKRAAIAATVLMVLALCFYAYINWRSHRAWRAFQSQLAARGAALELKPLLPKLAAEDENFAAQAAFRGLHFKTDPKQTGILLRKPHELRNAYEAYSQSEVRTLEWISGKPAPLDEYVTWFADSGTNNSIQNISPPAETILNALEAYHELLATLAIASGRTKIQFTTNGNALAVLQIPWASADQFEQLHFVYVVRALAELERSRADDAAEDIKTSLQLVNLGRQLPDIRATLRVQVMLGRSLQPLWEGLNQQKWNDLQLVTFQNQLEGIELLADYTNAVRRITMAYIQVWRGFAEDAGAPIQMPASSGGYTYNSDWRWQPRVWWLENCIQLFQASEKAIGRIDVENDRVGMESNWSETQGLNLDQQASQVFGTYYWGGKPTPAVLAFAECMLNQAILACALERYRLDQGEYPANLGQLVPVFLHRVRNDPVVGRPMGYDMGFPYQWNS